MTRKVAYLVSQSIRLTNTSESRGHPIDLCFPFRNPLGTNLPKFRKKGRFDIKIEICSHDPLQNGGCEVSPHFSETLSKKAFDPVLSTKAQSTYRAVSDPEQIFNPLFSHHVSCTCIHPNLQLLRHQRLKGTSPLPLTPLPLMGQKNAQGELDVSYI